MTEIMTWKLAVKFIVGCCTIVTTVVHRKEFEKIYIAILTMMLHEVSNKYWQPECLAHLRIPGKVDTDHEYNQGLFHRSKQIFKNGAMCYLTKTGRFYCGERDNLTGNFPNH